MTEQYRGVHFTILNYDFVVVHVIHTTDYAINYHYDLVALRSA